MAITQVGGREQGFVRTTTGIPAPLTAGELLDFAARLPPDAPIRMVLVLDQGYARLHGGSGEDIRAIYLDATIEGSGG